MDGLHHVHKRKELDRYPSPSAFKYALDKLMVVAAVAAPVALLPQVWQLYASQDASGFSLPSWLALGGINVLWVLYGAVHKEPPIVITHSMFMLLNFAIALGIVIF